ncbi:unnamed protein product [Natator depressus]
MRFLKTRIFCFEEDMPSLEEDPWTAPSLKDEGLQSSSLQRFAQLVKRGKFQQFYGLMGKRASGFDTGLGQQPATSCMAAIA